MDSFDSNLLKISNSFIQYNYLVYNEKDCTYIYYLFYGVLKLKNKYVRKVVKHCLIDMRRWWVQISQLCLVWDKCLKLTTWMEISWPISSQNPFNQFVEQSWIFKSQRSHCWCLYWADFGNTLETLHWLTGNAK